MRVARELGVDAFVFEEGYVRPNWLTVERNGVHGHLELPTDPAFYRRAHDELPPSHEPEPVGMPFRVLGWYTTWYSVANTCSTIVAEPCLDPIESGARPGGQAKTCNGRRMLPLGEPTRRRRARARAGRAG